MDFSPSGSGKLHGTTGSFSVFTICANYDGSGSDLHKRMVELFLRSFRIPDIGELFGCDSSFDLCSLSF